ncbi:unnamed protein product [Lota lota]
MGGASWCQLRGKLSKVADTCPNSWRDGSPCLQAMVEETPADDSVIWSFQVGCGSVRNRRRGASNCGYTSALEELKLQTTAQVQSGVEIEKGGGCGLLAEVGTRSHRAVDPQNTEGYGVQCPAVRKCYSRTWPALGRSGGPVERRGLTMCHSRAIHGPDDVQPTRRSDRKCSGALHTAGGCGDAF